MNRRLVEMTFLLPWVGAFLFTPPAVLILRTWSRAAEFPLFIIYIFVCWLLLIVAGGILSVRLGRMEDSSSAGNSGAIRRDEERD